MSAKLRLKPASRPLNFSTPALNHVRTILHLFAYAALIRLIFMAPLLTCPSLAAGNVLSPGLPNPTAPQRYRPDRILIKRKPLHPSLQSFVPARVLKHYQASNLDLVEVPAGVQVQDMINQYQGNPAVEFAEPDYLAHASVLPNDPHFYNGRLWGLNNTGQNGGTPDADIDAPEGWNVITSAKKIIVAVIDSGIRYTHEDLMTNLWRNPDEIAGNAVDDDGNGIVDDIYGYNAISNNGDPKDDSGHGTHVAGILGAAGNNTKGITGTAWNVQIMALKFLDSTTYGAISDAIECIEYARAHGAAIINASWNSESYSAALYNAIAAARAAGIIFVAAAGNNSANLDTTASYPAGYNLDNIAVVAATTRNGLLDSNYSNYGAETVDLGAPGSSIYSTWNSGDSDYAFLSGTSMAAPYVSGALALMRAYYPTLTYRQLISKLLSTTDPNPSLAGKSRSGGTLNLRKALGAAGPDYNPNPPPALLETISRPSRGLFQVKLHGEAGRAYVLQAATNLGQWTAISTNTAGPDGLLVFTDLSASKYNSRYYRAITRP